MNFQSAADEGASARHPDNPPAAGTPQARPHAWPEEYGDDRMVLMVRDPYWCYAYWDLSVEKRRRIQAELQAPERKAELILRVYEVPASAGNIGSARQYMDIVISPETNNWYINVWEPGHSYGASLGLLYDHQHFAEILQSNIVTTPRDSVSEVLDEEWMWPGEMRAGLFPEPGTGHAAYSSGRLEEYFVRRLRAETSSEGSAGMRPVRKHPRR